MNKGETFDARLDEVEKLRVILKMHDITSHFHNAKYDDGSIKSWCIFLSKDGDSIFKIFLSFEKFSDYIRAFIRLV